MKEIICTLEYVIVAVFNEMRKVAGCTNGGSRAENCNFYCACK